MRIVFLLLAIMLGAIPAKAAPRVVETIRYYDVHAESAGELRRVMDIIGPVDRQANRTCSALTEWTINWRYRFTPSSKGCHIYRVTTEVLVTITMPRLVSSNAELRKTFADYSRSLLIHERAHSSHAIEAARLMERAMADLSPRPDCTILQNDANAIGVAFLRAAQYNDRILDLMTGHGVTQGVVLP